MPRARRRGETSRHRSDTHEIASGGHKHLTNVEPELFSVRAGPHPRSLSSLGGFRLH
jgi:hypothetical protein